MSSPARFSLTMQAVVSSLNEKDAYALQERLRRIVPTLSFSPLREQPSLEDCLEFAATAVVSEEQKEILLATVDNDWDRADDEELYWAYGFNTKMMDPLLYYVQMNFQPLHS